MAEEYSRPDPDELLRRISVDERDTGRGSLTVYFGYAPGVGKTYSMLYDARIYAGEGKDIVIGFVQTHGRRETEALMEGLELIPTKPVEYSGLTVHEMDLDAILKRKPDTVIVDELAHTNMPGMKHKKRYQDVQEILDAGINVNTTFNVQHLESLNDIIFKITGIRVKETIPDPLFQWSDEVKLIDLPIYDLFKRLKEGKVYTKDMAQEAIHRYFGHQNLLGLRQLALRQVAIRIDRQMFSYMRKHEMTGPWYASERVLVGLHASPYATQIIRSAFVLSSEINAELIALHVVSGQDRKFTDEERMWLENAVKLAEALQVKTVSVKGDDISEGIARFANENNVTKIVIGKPLRQGNLRSIDRLLRLTSGVDVYIFAGQGEEKFIKSWASSRNPLNHILKYIRE